MSDATERPATDSDAWAAACAEDLEAERARRRAEYGPPPVSAAEELRKLVDAVADRVSALPGPLFGIAAQGAVQQFINQAKAVVEPVIERNPGVFGHLAAAGNELLAAYRSAVETEEGRWTRDSSSAPTAPSTGAPSPLAKDAPYDTKKSDDPTDPRDEGPGPSGHIDLD
ncbi:DUF5304 domain-containing protein [Streptomyces sp. NPDC057617]|uniref:DUF5304 domain-containing protein n=1 Tax=unclassified Streptomyces TaxID=2593676 RepID=UPI00369DE225